MFVERHVHYFYVSKMEQNKTHEKLTEARSLIKPNKECQKYLIVGEAEDFAEMFYFSLFLL